jgi:hypothetical protein
MSTRTVNWRDTTVGVTAFVSGLVMFFTHKVITRRGRPEGDTSSD